MKRCTRKMAIAACATTNFIVFIADYEHLIFAARHYSAYANNNASVLRNLTVVRDVWGDTFLSQDGTNL